MSVAPAPAPLLELSTEVQELQARWLAFAAHARTCIPGPDRASRGQDCRRVARACCQPGRQSSQLDQLYEECCIDGKPLFGDWRLACRALSAAYTHR